MVYPLNELNPGETAEVVWIISDPYMSDRLDSLGFSFKEHITCILGGSRDSMSAYLIRSTGFLQQSFIRTPLRSIAFLRVPTKNGLIS